MGDFYNGGLGGNSLSFVGSNFVRGYIKKVDTHHAIFSSKKQVIKNIIAKKPLTNLYEMNSTITISSPWATKGAIENSAVPA